MAGNVTRMKPRLGSIIRSVPLFAAFCLLTACESFSLPGLLDSRLPTPSGETWPGTNPAAYDRMTAETRCRPTLAAPDCRLVPAPTPDPVAPGQPTPLAPAATPPAAP